MTYKDTHRRKTRWDEQNINIILSYVMSDCYRLSTDDDVRQRTKCENDFYHISTCHTLILVSV